MAKAKTKRKPAKRAESRRMAEHEAFMTRHERVRMDGQVLPFAVHPSSTVNPTWADSDPPLAEYRWSAAVAAIADAALLRGCQLSVPVRRDCIAYATCQIVKTLKTPVHAWYTARHGRLLLAVMEEDQIQEDEEDE